MKYFFYTLSLIILFSFSPITSADWETSPAQITIEILQPPTPLIADNKYFLVYELHLTNYHAAPAYITSLQVFSDKQKLNFADENLAKLIHPIGEKNSKENPLMINPGQSKMILMWLSFANQKDIPDYLTHQINIHTEHKNQPLNLKVVTDPMKIKKTAPIVVSAPLQGDNWLAGNAPSNTSAHRMANFVVNGHDYFAQRYAIDFIRMGKNGMSFEGDEKNNHSYYAYGQKILAVADGTVIEAIDNIPENIPHTDQRAVSMNVDTIGGNHIVIDLKNGYYAFYAHLIPGSLTVKKGAEVHRGEVLGLVGNSGNSTEPHLHFHIVDKPSFIGANGIPYAFDHFAIQKSEIISEDPIYKIKIYPELSFKKNELVLENAVVGF